MSINGKIQALRAAGWKVIDRNGAYLITDPQNGNRLMGNCLEQMVESIYPTFCEWVGA